MVPTVPTLKANLVIHAAACVALFRSLVLGCAVVNLPPPPAPPRCLGPESRTVRIGEAH